MAKFTNFKIEWETRLCEVNGRHGLFHTWEQWSKPVEASPMIGGPPAGVIAQVFGIVEFADGVERVNPVNIKFCDAENMFLADWNERFGKRGKFE